MDLTQESCTFRESNQLVPVVAVVDAVHGDDIAVCTVVGTVAAPVRWHVVDRDDRRTHSPRQVVAVVVVAAAGNACTPTMHHL